MPQRLVAANYVSPRTNTRCVMLWKLLWENNNPEPVPDELGRKYEISTLAKADGTPHDHLAKMLPAVLAKVIGGTFGENQ